MQSNRKPVGPRTHEGGAAEHTAPVDELRRTVMTCLLWEDTFYESGMSITSRVKALIPKCDPLEVANMALALRYKYNIRHMSLFMVRELARKSYPQYPRLVEATLAKVIRRADELAEFLSIYWADGKCPLSHDVKRGLARAFHNFNEYGFAKYNRQRTVKLRDVMFLVHPKPKDDEQAALFKRIADDTLAIPDTWEVALSSGASKYDTFMRLMDEDKLGALAALRNVRNMHDAGVPHILIGEYLLRAPGRERVLPFRYIAAARACPALEQEIDHAMLLNVGELPDEYRLHGSTVVLVDVSSSMYAQLSEKSDMSRLDAAAALAVLVRALCSDTQVFTFSNSLVRVPPRQGMALVDAIDQSQHHGYTYMAGALRQLHNMAPGAARTIVITDEQSQDGCHVPIGKGYMLNVGTYKNGVDRGGEWLRISGFSESVVDYITYLEKGVVPCDESLDG